MTSNELLEKVAKEVGPTDVMEMLEQAASDSVVPGACTVCHAVCESIEPDATDGYCYDCEANSVASVLVLAGII